MQIHTKLKKITNAQIFAHNTLDTKLYNGFSRNRQTQPKEFIILGTKPVSYSTASASTKHKHTNNIINIPRSNLILI